MKKTKRQWEKSNVDLDKFLTEPCEIDEALFVYLAEIVSPQYSSECIIQLGEAEYEKQGVLFYMSASSMNKKHFYLGILPKFQKPKY